MTSVTRGWLPGSWTNNNKAIDPTSLDDVAASVDFSVEANKANLSALLAAPRNAVMRRADVLPIDWPQALVFDPW
jgi:hypothetical protein